MLQKRRKVGGSKYRRREIDKLKEETGKGSKEENVGRRGEGEKEKGMQ
jgi:hypothetical protein